MFAQQEMIYWRNLLTSPWVAVHQMYFDWRPSIQVGLADLIHWAASPCIQTDPACVTLKWSFGFLVSCFLLFNFPFCDCMLCNAAWWGLVCTGVYFLGTSLLTMWYPGACVFERVCVLGFWSCCLWLASGWHWCSLFHNQTSGAADGESIRVHETKSSQTFRVARLK